MTALQCAALTLFMQERLAMYGTETLLRQERFTMCGTETLFTKPLVQTGGFWFMEGYR